MNKNEIYKPPESSLQEDGSTSASRPSALIIVMTVLLSVSLVAIPFFVKYANTGSPDGGTILVLIPAFIVVALFQVGKRFRNSKSRWEIYMWSQAVLALSQVITILQAFQAIEAQ